MLIHPCRVISKHHLVVVYTKFEVKRSILEGCRPIQTENPVFETLTGVSGSNTRYVACIGGTSLNVTRITQKWVWNNFSS